jgi:hypothetical protein
MRLYKINGHWKDQNNKAVEVEKDWDELPSSWESDGGIYGLTEDEIEEDFKDLELEYDG